MLSCMKTQVDREKKKKKTLLNIQLCAAKTKQKVTK